MKVVLTVLLRLVGKVEEALEVMEALMRLEIHSQDSVVRHTYEKAQFEVRKAKRPNYYEVLLSWSIVSDLAPRRSTGLPWLSLTAHIACNCCEDIGSSEDIICDGDKTGLQTSSNEVSPR